MLLNHLIYFLGNQDSVYRLITSTQALSNRLEISGHATKTLPRVIGTSAAHAAHNFIIHHENSIALAKGLQSWKICPSSWDGTQRRADNGLDNDSGNSLRAELFKHVFIL